jgi:hypothetical protein
VQGHLESSATVPQGRPGISLGTPFAWHVAQVPLPDEPAFRMVLIPTLINPSREEVAHDQSYVKAVESYMRAHDTGLVSEDW